MNWKPSEPRPPQTLWAVAILIWLTACASDADQSTAPVEMEELTGALVREAAARFADGRFQVDVQEPGEIDSAQAVAFTMLRIEQSPRFYSNVISYDVGRTVDATTLRPCGAFYAATSYVRSTETLTGEDLDFGPWWIVHLCGAAGSPTGVASVHALTRPEFEGFLGQFVSIVGLRSREVGMLSPEEAAARVAAVTGERITTVPKLYAPNRRDGIPQFYSRWRIEVEEPIGVRGLRFDRVRSTGTFFVGRDLDREFREQASDTPSVLVATEQQPEAFESHGVARRRDAVAVRFERFAKEVQP